jgi:hypothetical protein
VRAIEDLKDRGLKVLLAPFILMDIPAGNSLPNPYSVFAWQPADPWRGDITCIPAPGRVGSPDKTPAVNDMVAAFLGDAAPGDFSAEDDTVAYSGPAEWSYRRLVLHYAHLAEMAGGVDAFLIGSELRGLTQLRSSASAYPFVAALKDLAADVRSIVGASPKISYAADWSEYFGHQPADGSGDVFFHLDPLWADDEIDFIGIDLYHPLADWREEPGHLDEASGRSQYNLAYLHANISGGEGFDWYYSGPADRQAQSRTPITDGAAGKPWMFRFKDIEGWWSNSHFNRPGGTEALLPTDWVPRAKPMWFTELGCPAVDKGANQPNVFFDPKSDQSALPYFSSGSRDDLAQRSYIEAYQRFFDPEHPNFDGSNPISPSYGGRMVDPAHLHLWAWDARPYPYFPECADIWVDGPNWQLGHWLNGRLGSVPLSALIEAVLADHDFDDYAIADVNGLVGGYVVNEVLSARATLEPVLQAFRTDAADAGDKVLFRGRNRPGDLAVGPAALVEPPDEPNLTRSRAQETELASEIVLRVIDPGKDYRMAAASSRRLAGQSRRSVTLDLTAVLDFAEAERLTDLMLRDVWTGRERAELRLPPSGLAVEAGDLLSLTGGTRPEMLLAERIEDGHSRKLQLRRVDEASAPPPLKKARRNPPATTPAWGPPAVRIVDFAPPDGSEQHAPRMAVFTEPWPGTIAVYSGAAGGGFRLAMTLSAPATLGRLDSALAPGPLGVFDQVSAIEVTLFGGALSGLPDIDVLAGGNGAAVQTTGGAWEVLQFAHAELVGPRRYRLTRLLRGQCGTDQAMAEGAAAGADFVLLNGAVAALPVGPEQLGLPLRYRFGPARDSHAAPTFAELTIAAAGLGLKPFAPVQLRARRDGSGNVELAWIRRTRFGGVGWELSEVPLNEEREAYRLDIVDGAVLKRRVEPTSPAYVYSAADQAADFGGPASAFTARVVQLSATAGSGYTLQETVNV